MWVCAFAALSVLLLLTKSINGQEVAKSRPEKLEILEASAEAPARLILVKKDSYLIQAYADAFSILSEKNSCSSFYGGPLPATTVLNNLVMLVRREPLLREITFQRSGRQTFFKDEYAGVYYRLFAKASLNINGSFYQRREPTPKLPPDIRSFSSGTRAARVLVLLHELGHLILSDTGNSLLPDDGYDGLRSRTNTLRVLVVCQQQLESLRPASH